jgi:hypothetical protein
VSDGATANLEISLDAIIDEQELGPHFMLQVNTGNFNIKQQIDANALSVVMVQVTIPPLMVQPRELVVLVIDRIAPTRYEKEYENDLYLESMVLAYQKK